MTQHRLLLLALGTCLSGSPPLLLAQAPVAHPRRVGVLAPSTRTKEEVTLKPFFDQMRELGWIEGQNVAYDRVYADDEHERLPTLAAELVARKPELIYAPPPHRSWPRSMPRARSRSSSRRWATRRAPVSWSASRARAAT